MLGGSGRTSVLFGWGDAKSAPVSVEAAFASKENKRFPTAGDSIPMHKEDAMEPIQQIYQNDNHQISQNSADQGLQRSESMIPVASFGWSSDDRNKIEQNSFLPSLQSNVENDAVRQRQVRAAETKIVPQTDEASFLPTKKRVPEATLTGFRGKEESPVVLPPLSIANELPLSNASSQSNDFEQEEDDWGDMVSSPAVDPSSNLPHASTAKADNADGGDAPPNIPGKAFAPKPLESRTTVDLVSKSQPTASNTSTATVADGWASADFSFFDMTPKTTTKHSPPQKSSILKVSRPSPLKQVSLSDVPPKSQNNQMTAVVKPEVDQEKIVHDIIKNLPDLSYMFRK
jgi:hypothetical protein